MSEIEKQHGGAVRDMFNRISRHYDLLNRLVSFGQDWRWRRKAVNLLGDLRGRTALDLCCGTGDFISLFVRHYGDEIRVVGIDFAEEMLRLARDRLDVSSRPNIILCRGDALALPLKNNSIGAVTIGFGIRNINDREAALKEILRVLKPDGRVVILEPSQPDNRVIRLFFGFYFRRIMPLIGGLISGDRKAYCYLNDSVTKFPTPETFASLMRNGGYATVSVQRLALGTAVIYVGAK